MSRNSRNTGSRGMNRNTGRHRQTGSLAHAAGRFPAKGAICRRGSADPGMRYYSHSHYAAVGAAYLPRRAGRRY